MSRLNLSITGLIERPAKLVRSDELLHEELREKLFAMQNKVFRYHADIKYEMVNIILILKVALDLASLNLQRGRDHGLPLYNDWRKFCNLTEFSTFDEMAGVISNKTVRDRLEQLYNHPGYVINKLYN